MWTQRRVGAGLLTAALLLPVPVSAMQQAFQRGSPRQATGSGVTARTLVLHQREERREFNGFARSLRAQFRRSNGVTRASVERVIKDVLLDLRAHWRLETRTRTIASPFDFPDL